MKIIEILNENQEIKNLNLKLEIAELSKNNFLKVVFACSDEISESLHATIHNIIKSQVGEEFELSVEYNKIDKENTDINEIEISDIEILKAKQRIQIDKYRLALETPSIIEISNIENILGDINLNKVNGIDGIKNVSDEVYLCGKISFLKELKTKDKEVDGVITPGKIYYSFYLNDGTGSIRTTIFATQKNLNILSMLKDDMNIICFGKIDKFNDKFTYTIRAFAKCDFSLIVKEEPTVPEPTHYLTVIPEQYIETSQLSLFEFQNTYSDSVNEFLANKSYVVFDFETTGLDHEVDAVTELGAVKIVNGKITETFSTFVNPLVPIPEKITQLTHITDDMVKDAPLIEDVLMDFYKFCYNSSIVAHNIDFDFKFLRFNARKIGVTFKNTQYDTLILAREHIKGLKNYKLGTICEYLNVPLVDAHRAVNDCLATAKVFIKLTDYFNK